MLDMDIGSIDKQQSQGSTSSIHILNDDCLLRIFDFLNFEDKICLRRACKRWKFLLDYQLDKRLRALRLGQFLSRGGFQVTSGLDLQCDEHSYREHRQLTVNIFNDQLCHLPADPQTLCYSINRYDYLHRCLKLSSHNITMLSLGQLNVSYRLMLVLSSNLPNLEHLELINCASKLNECDNHFQGLLNSSKQQQHLPSLATFNSQKYEAIYGVSRNNNIYNQHLDEQTNSNERIIRRDFITKCDLVKGSQNSNRWPNLGHLLIRNCHQLSEISLSSILAMTSRTLTDLHVESNQRLSGEFLNYCGPKLQKLTIKYCPMMQLRFLDDLIKFKQVLNPSIRLHIGSNPLRDKVGQNTQLVDTFNLGQAHYCWL